MNGCTAVSHDILDFQREFSPLTASSYELGRRAPLFQGTSVYWCSDFELRPRLHFLPCRWRVAASDRQMAEGGPDGRW